MNIAQMIPLGNGIPKGAIAGPASFKPVEGGVIISTPIALPANRELPFLPIDGGMLSESGMPIARDIPFMEVGMPFGVGLQDTSLTLPNRHLLIEGSLPIDGALPSGGNLPMDFEMPFGEGLHDPVSFSVNQLFPLEGSFPMEGELPINAAMPIGVGMALPPWMSDGGGMSMIDGSQSIGVGVSSDKGSPGGALNKEGPHIPRNGTMPLVREGCQKNCRKRYWHFFVRYPIS